MSIAIRSSGSSTTEVVPTVPLVGQTFQPIFSLPSDVPNRSFAPKPSSRTTTLWFKMHSVSTCCCWCATETTTTTTTTAAAATGSSMIKGRRGTTCVVWKKEKRAIEVKQSKENCGMDIKMF